VCKWLDLRRSRSAAGDRRQTGKGEVHEWR
jgi:hypothetical protein